MGLKTHSSQSELQAIRTIADGSDIVRARLLSKLEGDHFVTDGGSPLYNRIIGLLTNGRPIPRTSLLRQDPIITADVRELLSIDGEICQSEDQADALVDQLELFRKLRCIYNGTRDMLDEMKEPDPKTVDNALASLERVVMQARASKNDLEMIHSGVGSNAEPVVDKVLSTDKPDRIRTGFTEFDEASGGWARKDLVLIAANTGGGKSVMAEQIAINSYTQDCRNVCIVSFEMDEEELYARLISNLSSTPFADVYMHKLATYTQGQKGNPKIRKCREAWESFNKHGEVRDCKFTVWCPTIDVTPNQIGAILKPAAYDLVIIDYVGLVAAEKEAALWENLGEITKQFKGVARRNDCVVAIMAQLDEETNKIKYAKAMRHHSSYVWWWNYDEEAEETGEIKVIQDKARHCKPFPFPLITNFSVMRFGDADPRANISDEDLSSKEQAARALAEAEGPNETMGKATVDLIADSLSKARETKALPEPQMDETEIARVDKKNSYTMMAHRLNNLSDDIPKLDDNDL